MRRSIADNRTFGSLVRTPSSLLWLQAQLERLLLLYFSLHPEFEYFQGFNDLVAVTAPNFMRLTGEFNVRGGHRG